MFQQRQRIGLPCLPRRGTRNELKNISVFGKLRVFFRYARRRVNGKTAPKGSCNCRYSQVISSRGLAVAGAYLCWQLQVCYPSWEAGGNLCPSLIHTFIFCRKACGKERSNHIPISPQGRGCAFVPE